MRLLLVNAVEDPGEPEARMLGVCRRLLDRGWTVTVTSPGEGARAVASWPRALRLAQRFDVVYLNSTVCGRLLPALRGTYTVLHVHVLVDRIPRHWHQADVVLADGPEVAERLDGLPARVVVPPTGDDPGSREQYAARLAELIAPAP